MSDSKFKNVYTDEAYASSYSQLEWTGTYHLVIRDLPEILKKHVSGERALDFGCGTGRSTRLLRALGYHAIGVDIAESMIANAHQLDPRGDYRLLASGDLESFEPGGYDLVLACFPFDNTPQSDKVSLLAKLRTLLAPEGRLVNVVSDPRIYLYEWASFTTAPFPENFLARDGDPVLIVTREFQGGRPARDIRCSAVAYSDIYDRAGLRIEAEYRPLGREEDGVAYVSETMIAPWVLYVLSQKQSK